jgi:hypothetical protein
MTGRENKNGADQKAGELGISVYGAGLRRPLSDASDGQTINKLAATVELTGFLSPMGAEPIFQPLGGRR